jgi:hypothetical protein
MVTTTATYRFIATHLDRSLAQKGAEKPVALETDYYLKNISNIKSIDDLLKNTRLFNYAMKAFGLEDMAYAKGLVRKILSDGVDDTKSLARRIDDDRFLQFATVFNFKRDGEDATAKTDAKQGVVDRYVRQSLELSAGEDNEGVRLALYFQREAPTVSSAFGLLADPALSKVVKTAFGLPDEMATADIDKQAAAILARLDLADLKDPQKLDRLITRFTAAWDATDTTAADPVLALFDTSSSSANVDINLIMTLNTLKHGGS